MKKTVSVAASVVAVAMLWLSPAGAANDNWIVDARMGCAVWNPNPVPNETVSWLGNCVDGKTSGKGLLTYTVKGEFHSRYGAASGAENTMASESSHSPTEGGSKRSGGTASRAERA